MGFKAVQKLINVQKQRGTPHRWARNRRNIQDVLENVAGCSWDLCDGGIMPIATPTHCILNLGPVKLGERGGAGVFAF